MVTFGDLMSLLLTFFVLLLSFSVMEEQKISQAIGSIQNALGVMPQNSSIFEFKQVADAEASQRSRTIEQLARRMRRKVQVLGMEKDIQVEYTKGGGLRINLPNEMLFDSARADLKPDALPILLEIAVLLNEVPEKAVEIRGHTDDRPIRDTTVFRDNQDLSYERARNVMLLLTNQAGLPREQAEVIALGDTQPIASNDTEEGRQANRRVEIEIRGDFSDDVMDKVKEGIDGMTPSSVPS